ncbi:MAG: M23 family peptidase, partial [Bradyrhizobium sp.]|nr:M23 family peptidase [Bradyrhizobium sp.]
MKTKAVRYVARTLASFVLLKAGTAFAIDQFRTPAISVIPVEWRAALDQFRAEISAAPAVAADFTFATQRHLRPLGPRSMPAFVQLNAATSAIFPGINRSPVPVLLPFDVAGWLNAGGNRMTFGVARYQADFRSTDFFDAGPSGYDAVFSLEPGAGDGLPQRTFARPI